MGWAECADSTMSPKALRCGLAIVSQGKSVKQADANIVFEFGLGLQRKNKYRLSFPIFLLVSDYFRIFTGFEVQVEGGTVRKADLQKRLLEQDLPLRMTTTAAEAIIDLEGIDSFDFPSFASALLLFNRWYL